MHFFVSTPKPTLQQSQPHEINPAKPKTPFDYLCDISHELPTIFVKKTVSKL